MNSKFFVVLILLLSFLSLYAQNDNNLIPQHTPYYIQSAKSYGHSQKGFWDLPGDNNFKLGNKWAAWSYNMPTQYIRSLDVDRKLVIVPSNDHDYVRMRLDNIGNAYVDVQGGKSKNGTRIQIWSADNKPQQNWRFVYQGNGRWKIYSQIKSKIICLQSKSDKNGKRIHLWDDHNGPWTEWVLINAKTGRALMPQKKLQFKTRPNAWANLDNAKWFVVQSAMNYGKNAGGCWDVPGRHKPKAGENIQVWDLDAVDADRIFAIGQTDEQAYYRIIIAPNIGTGFSIDIAGGRYENGTNLGIWKSHNGNAQKFYLKHLGGGKYKIYNKNGKILCLSGKSNVNGSNVHLWADHNGAWTEWYLLDVSTRNPILPANANKSSNGSIKSSNGSIKSSNGSIKSSNGNSQNKIKRLISH